MRISYLIAFAVAVAVFGWVASGQDLAMLFDNPQTVEESVVKSIDIPEPAQEISNQIMKVRTVTQSAVLMPKIIEVRGQTEVSRSVVVRSEIPGVVDKILISKGDRVVTGETIALLSPADMLARLAEIKALVNQREAEYTIARSLTQQGHRPTTALAAAETALESSRAGLERIQLEIEKTNIKAPFDGVVELRQVQIGDYIGPGNPIALIVDENPFLVVGNVSETDIDNVKVGAKGTANFLDGSSIEGVITFIATIADSQTRTFRIELEVQNQDKTLRAGLTTDITLPVGQILAHFVSPAALDLDDQGNLGVKIVNSTGLVEFISAEVISSDSTGVWLSGLPQTASIITVGHQFVQAGDLVEVVADVESTD